MWLTLLPALLYLALHLLGNGYPALLWGADQLHYYPTLVGVLFVGVALGGMAAAARPSWALRLDQAATQQIGQLAGSSLNRVWVKAALMLAFFLFAYACRVRAHSLGDSSMWFRNLELSLAGAPAGRITWIRPLPIPGLEHVPAFEALDFLVHLQAYRLGHQLLGWTPEDAYAWLSCAAGALYVLLLWRIAAELAQPILVRATLFALFVTLGSIQLFFGYGESYTLVTLVSACYLLSALSCLRGRSFLHPCLWLLLAVGLHAMAVSLVPSLIYLIWRRRGCPWSSFLQRPGVALPVLAACSAAGWYLYSAFYPSRLPLWTPDEEGKYAFLSVPHFALLANAALLVSPFGLVWGSVLWRRAVSADPVRSLAGWAAVGTGALVILHDAFLGGRDWDLLAFPGLFYTVWGARRLVLLEDGEKYLRQVRQAVLPLMAMHTALWIGVNAHPQRAVNRLGNLLQHTNQALHYREFSLGYYHLAIRDDARAAVPYYAAAITAAPADDQDPQGLRNRYRKHLGHAFTTIGEYGRAVAVLREAFALQPSVRDQNDLSAYQSLVKSLLGLGAQYHQLGRESEAGELWEEGAARCRQMLERQPEATWYHLYGSALFSLGRYGDAVEAFRQSTSLQPDARMRYPAYLDMAEALHRTGDTAAALSTLEAALQARPEKREAVERAKRRIASPPSRP
jgi:tetratricopeptide (TPR) repeat protein